MNLIKTIAIVAFLGVPLCSSTVFAQNDAGAFDASISLGYVGTTGNTETETFNTELLLTFRSVPWVHNLKFQALGSREDDSTTAERYYLEDKSDYDLGDDQYLFILGSLTDDRFSGFDYQAAVSAGYGRYFFRRDDFSLQGFGGLGYRQNKVPDFGSEGEVIFTIGENLEWQLGVNSRLVQSFVSEIGADLTVTKFDIALESNIIGNLATRLAFQVRNNSEVPEGVEKTDTQTSISLVYTF